MKAVIGRTTVRQVAFVGPYGVGKTTAVRVVSEIPVVSAEVLSSAARGQDSRVGRKLTTTVGLDYGEWRGPLGSPVAVVGTPGQARFGAVRRSATPRSTSVVLWLYGQNDYALDEAREWLGFLAGDRSMARLTVAVTRLDESPTCPQLADYRPLLEELGRDIPLLAADPRNRDDVVQVLHAALRMDSVSAGGAA
jgi:signal recognition particle receptor subunit beta